MRTAVLLGNRDTKRTIYFEKAARQNGLPFLVSGVGGVEALRFSR